MSKHTPGPWLRDGRTVYALNAKNFNRFFFSVMDAHTPDSELLAVATLAQAAPDLLEALEIYAAAYNEHWKPGMPILEPISDAAIAKARGEA